jgi:hypothetical protein
MNNFIKINKQFLSLILGLLLHSSLSAVTFRNEPLTNFIQPDEVLYATFPENSFVILEMENNNFDIRHKNISVIPNLKEVFLEAIDKNYCWFKAKGPFTFSTDILNRNKSHVIGEDCLNFHIRTSSMLINCLFECPSISITSNKMDFDDCFLIKPQVLNIIGDYPESGYDIIQVLFYDQPENPTIISGAIDLKDNQTTKRLIISNVKEIRVKFIWDSNPSKKSKIEKPSVISQNLQPSFINYQLPDKGSLKEVISDLFSPEFMPVTVLSIALVLYCISGDFWNKVKVSNQ